MRRWGAAVVVVAAVAVGCGDSTGEPAARDVEVDFVDETLAARTVRFEGTLTLAEIAGDETPVADTVVAIRGESDFSVPVTRTEMETSDGGAWSAETLSYGDAVLLRADTVGTIAPELPAFAQGKAWLQPCCEHAGSLGFSLPGLDTDPGSFLHSITDVSRDTERLGDESVRGVETEHLRVTVDTDRVAVFDDDGTFDVWVDDEQRLRRLELESELVAVRIEFFDYGADVQIEQPSADDIAVFEHDWADAMRLTGAWELAAQGEDHGVAWELWRSDNAASGSCWTFEHDLESLGEVEVMPLLPRELSEEVPSHGGRLAQCTGVALGLPPVQQVGFSVSFPGRARPFAVALLEPVEGAAQLTRRDGTVVEVATVAGGYAVAAVLAPDDGLREVRAGGRVLCSIEKMPRFDGPVVGDVSVLGCD